MTKIIVEQTEAGWRLRTSRGEPPGWRLISIDAEPGHELPDIDKMKGVFATKNAAVVSAFELNMYLMYVHQKRRKTIKRGVE